MHPRCELGYPEVMTKVQIRLGLEAPLSEAQLERISSAHRIYGFFKVAPEPATDALVVEYDASRVTPQEVQAALRNAGIAIRGK